LLQFPELTEVLRTCAKLPDAIKSNREAKRLSFLQRSVLRLANEKLYKKNTLQENKQKSNFFGQKIIKCW
jgi:hypothetical protein